MVQNNLKNNGPKIVKHNGSKNIWNTMVQNNLKKQRLKKYEIQRIKKISET